MQITEQQRLEHNRIYEEAIALVKNEILLSEHPRMRRPGWLLRRKLNRALSLFEHTTQINPENWSAMWMTGKVHQRLGDYAAAFSWFNRAYQLNPSQQDAAREASLCAMEIGRNDDATAISQ
jgi:Flp pilus assembly protein TadD